MQTIRQLNRENRSAVIAGGMPSLEGLDADTQGTVRTIWAALSLGSAVASTYHGYKRNDSVGWAVWWGFMGTVFPVITPTIALAQGFGKPKR